MKILPVLVSITVLTVGLFGGTLAYQTASGSSGASPESSQSAAAAAVPTSKRGHHQRTEVRWAPCKLPAVRNGAACVTEEVRTVVVPAPAAAAPALSPVRTAAHIAGADDDRSGRHDGGEHGDDDGHRDGGHRDGGGQGEHESEGD